jgi:hypothetical protein
MAVVVARRRRGLPLGGIEQQRLPGAGNGGGRSSLAWAKPVISPETPRRPKPASRE